MRRLDHRHRALAQNCWGGMPPPSVHTLKGSMERAICTLGEAYPATDEPAQRVLAARRRPGKGIRELVEGSSMSQRESESSLAVED